MKKTKLYLTAPTIGHSSECLRHEIYDHVYAELAGCGYQITADIFQAKKVLVVEMPGWDSCDRVARDIDEAFACEIPVMLIGLEEVL